MHRFLCVAAVALCATTAQAAEPERFDIVCQMNTTIRSLDSAGNPVGFKSERTIEVRYSLDLAGNRWCEETNCPKGRVTPFASLGEDVIVLDRAEAEDGRWTSTFTRSTGLFDVRLGPKPGVAGVELTASGPCRIDPFTGPSAPQS